MSPPGGNARQAEDRGGQAPADDLIDFYHRWPEFRPHAMLLTERPDLSPAERETVRWMILLVDRVSERDVRPLER